MDIRLVSDILNKRERVFMTWLRSSAVFLPDDKLISRLTLYIQYEYATMLTLFPTHRHTQLPIENQFFVKFFVNSAEMQLLKSESKKMFSAEIK